MTHACQSVFDPEKNREILDNENKSVMRSGVLPFPRPRKILDRMCVNIVSICQIKRSLQFVGKFFELVICRRSKFIRNFDVFMQIFRHMLYHVSASVVLALALVSVCISLSSVVYRYPTCFIRWMHKWENQNINSKRINDFCSINTTLHTNKPIHVYDTSTRSQLCPICSFDVI